MSAIAPRLAITRAPKPAPIPAAHARPRAAAVPVEREDRVEPALAPGAGAAGPGAGPRPPAPARARVAHTHPAAAARFVPVTVTIDVLGRFRIEVTGTTANELYNAAADALGMRGLLYRDDSLVPFEYRPRPLARVGVEKGMTLRFETYAQYPLCSAAAAGNIEAIHRWVASGVPVDSVDGHGKTPLIHSAECRRPAAVTELLRLGADVDATYEPSWRTEEPQVTALEALVDHRSRSEVSALTEGEWQRILDTIAALVAGGATTNDATDIVRSVLPMVRGNELRNHRWGQVYQLLTSREEYF